MGLSLGICRLGRLLELRLGFLELLKVDFVHRSQLVAVVLDQLKFFLQHLDLVLLQGVRSSRFLQLASRGLELGPQFLRIGLFAFLLNIEHDFHARGQV